MLSPTGASESTAWADDPLAGQPYRAIRLLGAGGMGEVFLAEHREFGTTCVVKIQHARLARDPSVADRIRLEAESLTRLNHANIVSIIGSGQTSDERPFIVMEYLRGQTMADELAARGQLPLQEALGYSCQVLCALAAAHAQGIVHRDIKPDNLFLCDGPRDNRLLKVLDFGVACTMPGALLHGLNPLAAPTATGAVVGALRYVSPEGALGRRVDHRADLYSAALVLYFALAGRGPFDHIQSALLLLSAHVAEDPEPPSHFSRSSVPAELDQIVLRALRKAPDERFQSANELREELERIMNQLRRSPDASEIRALSERGPSLVELNHSNREPQRDASTGPRKRARESSGPGLALEQTAPEQTAPEQTGPLRIGVTFLDKYEIREQIGRGGQAWVYHGQHIFTAREVAIKIIHAPRGMTREVIERGKAEARALGRLDHPNIVVMHDAGVTDEGLFYIVMELLRGRSLRSALAAHGRFSAEEVLHLAIQTAEALQAAHEIALIHRDLTPDNIHLTRDNRVKVLDFGIAKVLNEIGFTTHEDVVMGSILYMSPEQVQGLPLTPRSDICALGLVMFEMLAGKHPSLLLFERDLRARNQPHRRATLADIPPIQVDRTPPLLTELVPSLPSQLALLVQRAIAKKPEARFSTMHEFVAALRACQQSLDSDAPITLRQASDRDLSAHVVGESEAAPASQRATPRRGLVWDGTGCLTPAGLQPELFAVTTAGGGVAAARTGNHSRPRRAQRKQRAVAWLKNAIIAGCFIGAALGSLAAFRHFDTASRAPSHAQAELGPVALQALSSSSVAASLSPALPEIAPPPSPAWVVPPEPEPAPVAVVPRLGSSLALPGPSLHRSAPSARSPRARTPAIASAKSVDEMIDVSAPLEIALGGKPHKSSLSSAEGPRKKLNAGRPIYGD